MATFNKERLSEDLIRHEGFRSKPYKDTVGKLTIGIGRNIEDRGISRDEALYLLRSDIRLCEYDLDKNASWWREMEPIRQEVLLNMCFNMGWPTLSGFRNTLKYMRRGNYDKAADNMMKSKWARQVGYRAAELSNQMRTGRHRGYLAP